MELQEIYAADTVEPHHARLKALVLGVAVVASAATAGAAIGGHWIAPRIDRTIVASAAARADLTPRHHRGAIRRVADLGETPAIEAPVPAEDLAPPAREVHASSHSVRHSAAPAPIAEGRTEVLDALVALRHDHDADRAAGLLDRYLSANRHGALREEALALAIEAADARGNTAEAQRLARLYLAEFSGGRFGEFATRHLGADGLAPND
jgi:hypothetical protein